MKLTDLLEMFKDVVVVEANTELLNTNIKNVSFWSLGDEIWGNGTLLYIDSDNLRQFQDMEFNMHGVEAVAVYANGEDAISGTDLEKLSAKGLAILILPAEADFETLADVVRRRRFYSSPTLDNAWWQDDLLAY